MSTTTDLTTLKINYLTQAQYEEAVSGGSINEDEIYMTPASEHDATTNLFEPTFWGRTVSGVTYTFDETDNSYAVSGTATASVHPTLGLVDLSAGTYRLLGLQVAGSSSTFRLNLYNNANDTLIAQDKGDGALFALSEATTCKLALYINSGASLDIAIKPMITSDLSATMSDYVPYLYGHDSLNKEVAELKEKLRTAKLTGSKTRNDNTGWLYDLAQSWIDNSGSLYYGYDNNLFWDDTQAVGGKYAISCSLFVSVMIFGISFENSKYNGLSANKPNLYGYTDDDLLENLKGDCPSELMLPYFIEKGYAFEPSSKLGNVQTGDILYFDMDSSNNNYQDFMGVDHSAIYAHRVSDTRYAVWEVGNDDGAVLTEVSYTARNVVCAVRVPFKQDSESKRRVTLSTFTAPVALSSLFNFKHNNIANMWRVTLLGKAYARGATMSSIYLIRTNASGIIGDSVALYEGSGTNVRKLDSSYNIIDESGAYNQAVTVLVEWLG